MKYPNKDIKWLENLIENKSFDEIKKIIKEESA